MRCNGGEPSQELIHPPREAAGVYVSWHVRANHRNWFTDQTSWSGSQVSSAGAMAAYRRVLGPPGSREEGRPVHRWEQRQPNV